MKCPICGKDMEMGFVTIPLHYNLHSIKWNTAPEHQILDGEVLYDPKDDPTWLQWKVGSAFPAHRCMDCRVVLFYLPRSDDREATQELKES